VRDQRRWLKFKIEWMKSHLVESSATVNSHFIYLFIYFLFFIVVFVVVLE